MQHAPRRVPQILEQLLDEIPPASGAVVMGTGIVSIALLLDGQKLLSTILLAIAAAIRDRVAGAARGDACRGRS